MIRSLTTAFLALSSFAFAQSPEISPDGKVTFRVPAQDAEKVSVQGQWPEGKLEMKKEDKGIWTGTAVVPAGVWEYSVVVDGIAGIDPSNPAIKPMRQPRTSILHIPGTPPKPWDFRDVPHGTVHEHTYLSKALGKQREVRVYTPPGYEKGKELPLLVLQHGSGDNQRTWVEHGKAHWIFDNLLADGKAKPMIVLMLDGHPLGQQGRGSPVRDDALKAFLRELHEDAIPLVEAQYSVAKGSANRAIAGLSMGGWHSLSAGLGSDHFGWVGAFSAAPASDETIATAAAAKDQTNARLKLLWIACGKGDFLLKMNEDMIAKLKDKGIAHEWKLTEGDHSWPVWRDYLAEFTPRLFQ